jgi:hypothetical protein
MSEGVGGSSRERLQVALNFIRTITREASSISSTNRLFEEPKSKSRPGRKSSWPITKDTSCKRYIFLAKGTPFMVSSLVSKTLKVQSQSDTPILPYHQLCNVLGSFQLEPSRLDTY